LSYLSPTFRTKPFGSELAALCAAELASLDSARVFRGRWLWFRFAKDHVHGQLGALVRIAGHLPFLHALSVAPCLGNRQRELGLKLMHYRVAGPS
jgi:hypothetical protein